MAQRFSSGMQMLRNLPRVSLGNIRPLPGMRKQKKVRMGMHGRKCGRGNKGQGQRNTLPPLGFEGGNTPFYLLIPKEPYYQGHHMKRQYLPLSLLSLQRLVDLGRVDTTKPIDLTSICNSKVMRVDIRQNHYGFQLTDDGVDIFKAKVNIEVQWANEVTIAAIERNGGTITTKFYDLLCVDAMTDPERFFRKGLAIPKCKLPPSDAVEYYADARNRGYLADQQEIEKARLELAQKFGYSLPDITKDDTYEMLMMRKKPNQIWFGLNAGWAVSLRDRHILKPVDEEFRQFYES